VSPRAPAVRVRPLEPGDWELVADLFGERGACGGCWCMAWRRPGREWEEHKGASNRRAFRRLVTNGAATGVLALADGVAVGWCSAGPRADFRSLETKRSLRTEWDEHTWSVTCFFLRKEWRGRGLGRRLLEGAVALAREHGARRIEGYPVAPTSGFGAGDKRMPAAFVWTGLPRMFERARFRPLPETPGKRPIYVRDLRPRRTPVT